MKTLSQILADSAAYLDLDPSLPTGTELTVRINYAQQAVNEWGGVYKWRQLRQAYDPLATGATVSLPSNFREFMGAPRNKVASDTWDEYPEIRAEDRYNYLDNDKYCYVLGNPSSGLNVIFNGLTNASLSMVYQRYPSNMVTLTDVCEVPDAEYVKTKVISYVLQSRGDDRFPLVDADANRMLQNMIGREMQQVPGGYNNTPLSGHAKYRLGT